MIDHRNTHGFMNSDRIPVVSTGVFHWDAKTREFVTEASTIEANVPGFGGVSQMMVLRSAKTNKDKWFTYVRTERDGEGEVLARHFLDVTSGLKVVVLND